MAAVKAITVKPPLTQRLKLHAIWWVSFISSLIVLYWQRGSIESGLRGLLAQGPLSFMLDWQLHVWFPTFLFPIIGFAIAKICASAYKAKFKEVAPQELTEMIYGLRDDVRSLNDHMKTFWSVVKPALTAHGVELRVDKTGAAKVTTQQWQEKQRRREEKQYQEELEAQVDDYSDKIKEIKEGGEI